MGRQSMLISADWRVQSGGSGIILILPFRDVANPVFVVRSAGATKSGNLLTISPKVGTKHLLRHLTL